MKLESCLTVAATLALLATPVLAAEHPDMTGTWVLDAVKSEFGPMPGPSDLVFTIKAEGPDFSVLQTGGGQPDLELHFNTAGKEATNQVPGAKMTSTHHWEGAVLVGQILVTGDDGSNMTFKDRISYSPDGKVMTLDRAMSGPMGDGKMKMVLDRK
jgi:hypothetical protein